MNLDVNLIVVTSYTEDIEAEDDRTHGVLPEVHRRWNYLDSYL